MEGKPWERDKPKDDGIDRGEIRTEFARSNDDIHAGGKTMCTKHVFRKLSENEVYCTQCPTVLLVNPEAVEELIQ